MEQLAARLEDPSLTILDVRTPEEFAGTAGYHCDRRQGHIPGALNVDVTALAARTPEQVRALLGLPEGAEICAYCHSGARSATAVGILRDAGYRARNYRGSWHEWANREDLPLER